MTAQQQEALAQECADYATSLLSTVNLVQLTGKEPPQSMLRAADIFERASADIRRLHARVQELEAEVLEQCRINGIGSERELRLMARVRELETQLVKEASRTAEEKLRADQMSQQHDTQAALNREARAQLAAKQERKPLSEDDVGLWVVRTLCAASKQDKYSTLRNCVPLGSELAPLFLEFARDHGITQEPQ